MPVRGTELRFKLDQDKAVVAVILYRIVSDFFKVKSWVVLNDDLINMQWSMH